MRKMTTQNLNRITKSKSWPVKNCIDNYRNKIRKIAWTGKTGEKDRYLKRKKINKTKMFQMIEVSERERKVTRVFFNYSQNKLT